MAAGKITSFREMPLNKEIEGVFNARCLAMSHDILVNVNISLIKA
jgi:hypothetical protein